MTINNNFTRAGAKNSAKSITDTQTVMHEARNHALNAAHRACAACGCDDCADVQGRLEGAPSFEPSASMALDKSQSGTIERGNTIAVLDRLQASGFLSTHQRQLAAAQLAISPMYGNNKV